MDERPKRRMPRILRMVRRTSGQRCVYPVIRLTALDGSPFKKCEKDEQIRVIRWFSMVYAVDVLGFSIMDRHFNLCVDDAVRRRFIFLYKKGTKFFERGD